MKNIIERFRSFFRFYFTLKIQNIEFAETNGV